jgi:hypothetical protein
MEETIRALHLNDATARPYSRASLALGAVFTACWIVPWITRAIYAGFIAPEAWSAEVVPFFARLCDLLTMRSVLGAAVPTPPFFAVPAIVAFSASIVRDRTQARGSSLVFATLGLALNALALGVWAISAWGM